MQDPTAVRVSATVRAELARANLRNAAVAERLGLSRSALHRRLSGAQAFRVAELAAIADLLDTSVAALVSEPQTAAGGAA